MNIYDDPLTIPRDRLAEKLDGWWLAKVGHYFNGPDGGVYRLIGWRENDGPWMEEVLGRSLSGSKPTRTISGRAIGRTFHHHPACPAKGCERRRPHYCQIEWSGVQQVTDGQTIWINARDGMCIGRLSPRGIDVHANAQRQLDGEHCLHCEPAAEPFASEITFAMYVRFCEKMKEHHGVTVSKALPVAIREEILG